MNHEAELSRLLEQHMIEKNNAIQEKQKEHDIKIQEGKRTQIKFRRTCIFYKDKPVQILRK